MDKKKTDINPESDSLDSNPEFADQMDEMQEDFFGKEDPGFKAMMDKFKVKEEDADESPTQSD